MARQYRSESTARTSSGLSGAMEPRTVVGYCTVISIFLDMIEDIHHRDCILNKVGLRHRYMNSVSIGYVVRPHTEALTSPCAPTVKRHPMQTPGPESAFYCLESCNVFAVVSKKLAGNGAKAVTRVCFVIPVSSHSVCGTVANGKKKLLV